MAGECIVKGNPAKLDKLFAQLEKFSLHNTNPTARLGGLYALAQVAVDLKKCRQEVVDEHAGRLLNPILTSANDTNIVLRKAALDALFNTIKVLRVS